MLITHLGHILPGDTLKISFIFKSALAGIFTETWEFLTTPPVMGGAALWVSIINDQLVLMKLSCLDT